MKSWNIQNRMAGTLEIKIPHKVLGPFESFVIFGSLTEDIMYKKGEKKVTVTLLPEPEPVNELPKKSKMLEKTSIKIQPQEGAEHA
jgi:hypothetical protein